MSNKSSSFHLFRYQILPQKRKFHGDLFNGISSVEELIAQKNVFFRKALEPIVNFHSGQTEITTRRLFAKDDFYLYKIAANRSLFRENKDFTEEHLDNWPSIVVAIWNHPDKQLIAVQNRTAAFQNSETVAKFILSCVGEKLKGAYLSVSSEQLFYKKAFWDLVASNSNRITSVEFQFITPNMANISGNLKDDLKSFAKTSNSAKNKVVIESSSDSVLELDEANENLVGLVDYSSEGGGNITMKIGGVNKKVTTSKTAKEISVSELELTGPPEQVANLMKNLIG